MTNEKILKALIQKAVDNGFKRGELVLEMMNNDKYSYSVEAQSVILFNPDFAKALWGETKHYHISRIYEKCGVSFVSNYQHCTGCGSKIVIKKKAFMFKTWENKQHLLLNKIQAGKDIFKYLEKFV